MAATEGRRCRRRRRRCRRRGCSRRGSRAAAIASGPVALEERCAGAQQRVQAMVRVLRWYAGLTRRLVRQQPLCAHAHTKQTAMQQATDLDLESRREVKVRPVTFCPDAQNHAVGRVEE